jgi:hypothetical protein
VKKTGCWQREVAQWSNCVAKDFGALAGLQAHAQMRQYFFTPDHTNGMRPALQLLWCLGATDHGWTGTILAVGELECTADMSQRMETVVLGIYCFSSRRVVVDTRSVPSLL